MGFERNAAALFLKMRMAGVKLDRVLTLDTRTFIWISATTTGH